MNKKAVLQKTLVWVVQELVCLASCAVAVMGYHLLIPGMFASQYTTKDRRRIVGIGLLLGLFLFAPAVTVVKYIIILMATAIGIRFYIWANRSCSSFVAGIIAALVSAVINCSGELFVPGEKYGLVLGICEGVLSVGITVVMAYIWNRMEHMKFHDWWEDNTLTPRKNKEEDEKLQNFATAVSGLSDAIGHWNQMQNTDMTENMGALEQEIMGNMCATCEGNMICLTNFGAQRTVSIQKMLRAVMEHRQRSDILKQEYVTGCPKYPGMVDEAIQAFGRIELNRSWYNRLVENRMVIAQQLDAMSELLTDWNKDEKPVIKKASGMIAKIAFEAKEKGLLVENVQLFENGRGRRSVRAVVCSKWGGGIPSERYARALEKALHRPMALGRNARAIITREPTEVLAYEDTVYHMLSGMATRKKDFSTVSGDSYGVFDNDKGKYYVCLSDGMGSGERARRESELVVELLQKLIEGGFSPATAIQMMNSAMVLQGDKDTFSTLDLSEVDLYSGDLTITKVGAAPTFIKRGEKVECLSAPSLPAGSRILDPAEPLHTTLGKGDFLVMVTDGVLEYLHVKEPEEKMCEIIASIRTDNATAMATTILNRVLLFAGNHAMDDMTVLALGMWEK